jgi:hypothetical protein
LLASGAGLVIALSTVALAQIGKGNAKSQEVTTVGEGEAVMIGPKGQRLHIGPRAVCAKCGSRGNKIDVRPNWKEQLPQQSLTGKVFR